MDVGKRAKRKIYRICPNKREGFMNILVNKIISSIVQILLFSLIPFVWWFVLDRRKQKFGKWIGLKKMEGGKNTVFLLF